MPPAVPVRPGHRDEAHPGGSQRQGLGAMDDQLSASARDSQLGIVFSDGARHDDDRFGIDVGGIVPNIDTHAHGTQVIENLRLFAVRARDDRSARHQQFGNDAHPRSADADQMKTILKARLTHVRPFLPAP